MFFAKTKATEDYRNDIRKVLRLCSNEKLVSVLDACTAGKMKYTSPCNCLVGILSSEGPHQCKSDGAPEHYLTAIENRDFDRADHAYRILGYPKGTNPAARHEKIANNLTQFRRDQELSVLLREEMASRGLDGMHEPELQADAEKSIAVQKVPSGI